MELWLKEKMADIKAVDRGYPKELLKRNLEAAITDTGSCNEKYHNLQFFVAQSSLSRPSIPSYCQGVLDGDIQLMAGKQAKGKEINETESGNPCCLLHYGILAKISDEKRYSNLKKLVDLGADREQCDKHGRTPLHLAVLLGDTKAVDVLLEAGCDTAAKCHGNNLMHLATISGDPDMFHKVRKLGFDPQELTEYGFTSVHLAACYNQHQMIPLLKSCGLDVNKRSEILVGTNPFRQAIMPVGGPCFQSYTLQILKGIARTIVKSKINRTISGNSNATQDRFVHGINKSKHSVATESNSSGNPPLVLATTLGFVQSAKALVDNGANPLCVDSNGDSLLDAASIIGHLELVKYLIQCHNSLATSIKHSSILSTVMIGAVDVVEFLVTQCSKDFRISTPNSQIFSSMSLVDFAALLNQPDVLQLACTMYKCKSGINWPEKANYLLLFSISGSWFLNILSKVFPDLAPVFQVTEERQRAVVSAILDMPGCNPTDTIQLINVCAVDAAVMFHQSTALGVMLDRVRLLDGLPHLSAFESLPMLHACVYSSVWIQDWLKADPGLNFLSLVDPSIDEFRSTFDILLKNGYNINIVDYCGQTCLDHAMEVAIPGMESYLCSRGALTGEQLKKKKEYLEQAEILILDQKETAHKVTQLKDEKMKLVEEKKDLMVQNQELRTQNQDLSRRMAAFFEQMSPLLALLRPGSNPPSSEPFNEIRLDEGTLLDDEDVKLMAAKWWDIGTCLGLKLPILDNIKADHSRSCEQACREMLTRWCKRESRTGDKSRTLNVILEALVQCGCEEYAAELEEKHKL